MLLTVVVVCALSLLLGQGLLSALGRRGWSWAAPAIGFAALLVISSLAISLPGHALTARLVVLGAGLASAFVVLRREGSLPPPAIVPVAVLTLLVTLVPFLANARLGILGVRDNADLSAHLLLADAVRVGGDVDGSAFGPGYPTGPHALAAALTGFGTDVERSFTAILLALPVLTAITALAVLASLPPIRRTIGAALVGVPYLGAAYLVQASFKEPMVALLVLGVVIVLHEVSEGRLRPAQFGGALGFLAAGCLATYSFTGLAWPVAIVGLWMASEMALRRRLPGRRDIRPLAVGAGLAALVLAVVALPDLGRLSIFSQGVAAVAEGGTAGGNISQRIPGYQLLGVWPSENFRVTPNSFYAGMLAAVGLVVAAYSTPWWVRRRAIVIPAAALGCLVVYAGSRLTTTPYYNAKALAIAAPLVMMALVCPVLTDLPPLRQILARRRLSPALALSAALALIFLLGAGLSSWLALRAARVGPSDHARELAELRPLIQGRKTLFFGQDDYVYWELRGAEVSTTIAYIGQRRVPFDFRTEKRFAEGAPVDFDSLDSGNLDQFAYVITPRADFTSRPPPNWRPVRATRSYQLYERTGPSPNREILGEGGGPGAVLDCDEPDQKRLSRRSGVAAVRSLPVARPPNEWRADQAAVPAVREFGYAVAPPGVTVSQRLRLPAGRWKLSLQYLSPGAVRVTGPGLDVGVPPYEERAGPYWPVGTVVSPGGRVTVSARLRTPAFYARSFPARLGTLVATREEATRMVPLRRACGRYVDWFELHDVEEGPGSLASRRPGGVPPGTGSGGGPRAARVG